MNKATKSPSFSVTARPRHLFGIDRKGIPVVVVLAVAAIFSRSGYHVQFAVASVVAYMGFKAQWEINPYLWRELWSELGAPYLRRPQYWGDRFWEVRYPKHLIAATLMRAKR